MTKASLKLAKINYESWNEEIKVREMEFKRAKKALESARTRKTIAFNHIKNIEKKLLDS